MDPIFCACGCGKPLDTHTELADGIAQCRDCGALLRGEDHYKTHLFAAHTRVSYFYGEQAVSLIEFARSQPPRGRR